MNKELIETKNGYSLYIVPDTHPECPREWDNLGTMAFFHKRYNLGDKDHGLTLDDAMLIPENPDYISLPVYMYDHSGITISTKPFSCRFDSGQLGIIFVSREKLIKEQLNDKSDDEIRTYLENEVKTYDQYLMGDCYGYEIRDSENNEYIDSCWGFYDMKDVLEEGKKDLEYWASKQLELTLDIRR